MNLCVLLLGRDSLSTRLTLSTLGKRGFKVVWFEERRDDKLQLIKKRIKKFGLFYVLNQVAFQIFQKLLNIFSKKRLAEYENDCYENSEPVKTFTNINEINKLDLQNIDYDMVLLCGTRILSNDTLNKFIPSPVVNIHAGITPAYRGVHGGYWSLANNDVDMFGSTIHYVDSGIDTGSVISYVHCQPEAVDNFVTYPILQQVKAVERLVEVIPSILHGGAVLTGYSCQSKLWSHPTLTQYFKNYLFKGVK
ncbi:MAG: folate-dependent phosphoribosylglycinamide formyltransferase PurN [Oceanicoccus sp.]|jgi:folate-dependent phosphoribosylglycinamide formyltransferase PurN